MRFKCFSEREQENKLTGSHQRKGSQNLDKSGSTPLWGVVDRDLFTNSFSLFIVTSSTCIVTFIFAYRVHTFLK